MDKEFKKIFMFLTSFAFALGFVSPFFTETKYNFQYLHIFLFNLCSGGTVVVYFSEKQDHFSVRTKLFFFLSIIYTFMVFLNLLVSAAIISFILALIVEKVRLNKFSLFPIGFFKKRELVYEKFHQASLLCLSISLIVSSFVILNDKYSFLTNVPKLQLENFFLGFSFPLSLISFSIMFSFLESNSCEYFRVFKKFSFWIINLGVIIFFLLILFEKLYLQLVIISILIMTIFLIFYFYLKLGEDVQQKKIIISGLCFLSSTAFSGLAYVLIKVLYGRNNPELLGSILHFHSFSSLYGWNVCGLIVISRLNDFPVRTNITTLVILHWISILILAPIGIHFQLAAIISVFTYIIVLFILLFSESKDKNYIRNTATDSLT